MSERAFGPLVDTEWLAENLGDPDLVVVEADEQPLLHGTGHVPGARNLDWDRDLRDPVTRDLPSPESIRDLWGRLGVTVRSSVVLYGDKNNWYACFAYWLFRHYGLERIAILDGGRQAWLAEERPLDRETPPAGTAGPQTPAARPSGAVRASWSDVRAGGCVLLDVRTPAEYSGEALTEPGYPHEIAQRAGHIPGARNVPWDIATGPDGRFLPLDELARIYADAGATDDSDVIAYCRIGERSAHTWFVLHELLGHERTRNYDGSWTEWGSMVGMPVALGEEPGEMPAPAPRAA